MLTSWMSILPIDNENIFCLETGNCLSVEKVVQRCSNQGKKLDHVPDFKQNVINKKHSNQLFFGLQVSYAKINFIAFSLTIIIGFYLLACTIAPLVNLNTQTFRIIFTTVGGIPSILYFSAFQNDYKNK